jgi:hypothetical protein
VVRATPRPAMSWHDDLHVATDDGNYEYNRVPHRLYQERPAPLLRLAKLLLPIDGDLDPKAEDRHDQEQEVEMCDHPNLPGAPVGPIPDRRFRF